MAANTRINLDTSPLAPEPSSSLSTYRKIVIQLLTEHAERAQDPDLQTVEIFDQLRDRYQLLDMGWDCSGTRVFQPILQIDLIDEKVWIQENVTDWDVGQALVKAGVERSNIVLGMYSEAMRKLGEYASDV